MAMLVTRGHVMAKLVAAKNMLMVKVVTVVSVGDFVGNVVGDVGGDGGWVAMPVVAMIVAVTLRVAMVVVAIWVIQPPKRFQEQGGLPRW